MKRTILVCDWCTAPGPLASAVALLSLSNGHGTSGALTRDLCKRCAKKAVKLMRGPKGSRGPLSGSAGKKKNERGEYDPMKIEDALMKAVKVGPTTATWVARKIGIPRHAVQKRARELVGLKKIKSVGSGAGRRITLP